jgi:phytoene dehydrogenase-like protein
VLDGLRRFQYDNSTIKVDWALTEPIPWEDPAVRRAGTVHLGESMDHLTEATTDLERRMIPERPFLVMGQYAAADPTRAPAGADTAWGYTHVPQEARGDRRGELTGRWDEAELERYAGRMEDEIERVAPGFRERVAARHIAGPRELEATNANLVKGAINGGTAKLHQQLVFRPVPGLGRPETPVKNLYLGSASAHPGGGVHGAPGANAARALLAHQRLSLSR